MTVTRFAIVLAGAVVALAPFASAVSARDVTVRRTVQPDKPSDIWVHSSSRRDCATRIPDIHIVEQPANGLLSIRNGERTLSGYKGAMEKCNGKSGVGAFVVFTPNAGFTGRNRARYRVSFASGREMNVTALIQVGKRVREEAGWHVPDRPALDRPAPDRPAPDRPVAEQQ